MAKLCFDILLSHHPTINQEMDIFGYIYIYKSGLNQSLYPRGADSIIKVMVINYNQQSKINICENCSLYLLYCIYTSPSNSTTMVLQCYTPTLSIIKILLCNHTLKQNLMYWACYSFFTPLLSQTLLGCYYVPTTLLLQLLIGLLLCLHTPTILANTYSCFYVPTPLLIQLLLGLLIYTHTSTDISTTRLAIMSTHPY